MNIRVVALLLTSTLFVACATTTEKPRSTARFEIQGEYGFSITESVNVSDRVRADYERALLLLEQGQIGEGLTMLEAVVEKAPAVSGPRIDLGVAWHRKGDLETAERHLRAALELSPDHPLVHNELGIIYRKTGRFAEARRSYEAALAAYPGYHHARRNLGVLCDLYLADLECALASYEAYMNTVPEDAQASMWIADLRNRVNLPE